MKIGLDIGSTTIKTVVLDKENNIIFKQYERHFSEINKKAFDLLTYIKNHILNGEDASLMITGSAGMGIANKNDIPFIQEVYATKKACELLNHDTDVVIELGGEDAKILFLSDKLEVRMNGSCAGGTGAFIDQMATLLNCSPTDLNELSKKAEIVYTIASRCGVFAKTDIQPLLNQGAKKEDISKSIFYAVCNQTVGGLAQGREIKGNVLYLGGPLTFLSELRKAFDDTLDLKGIMPENSLYYVAIGAANNADTKVNIPFILESIKNEKHVDVFNFSKPLFENEKEFDEFIKRHEKASIKIHEVENYDKTAYLGVDSGSTTLKCVLMDENSEIIDTYYASNSGNPVHIFKEYLMDIYKKHPNIKIKSAASTGYGEEIIKSAFKLDGSLVETFAHFKAAKMFNKDVDFIIDIGGQDMKCFKIKNNTIDNIFLNEACSSGCGSFLQTFANALHKDIKEFAELGIYADKPVELGSRCTVFMNSSVKQAQKDGASTENISAGLSISVVKNAIYKVIRPASVKDLGENIVVQGGTFYNNAVLRAFEREIKNHVTRPNIAGLMGAYGSALYAKEIANEKSTILGVDELLAFKHKVTSTKCKLCENNCNLTINIFDSNRKYISGNRCDKPIKNKISDLHLNMFEEKRKMLMAYKPLKGKRKIGIPLTLNMYELYPFFYRLFTELGFEVITTGFSDRNLYLNGQNSIPSDTVCFPAKLVHGHIKELIGKGVDTIFYPCMSYNIDEKMGDNNYNCPVVAYYPEVINSNMNEIKDIRFIKDYIGIHRKKDFPRKFYQIIKKYYPDIHYLKLKLACNKAYKEYNLYMDKVYEKGLELIDLAKKNNKKIVILAGRPYHIDPEISHGIDTLITSYDACVITEDIASRLYNRKVQVKVLNQWTYHSRLYAACHYASENDGFEFVQLVSFGCGCDAITTDECREILERNNKIYTQLKIDEITNLGAVKIRIRSLFQATVERNKNGN